MDGPGLGEQGSGMYHLQRQEERQQSGTSCTYNNTKVSFETKRLGLWGTGKNKAWSVLTSAGTWPMSRFAIRQRQRVELFPLSPQVITIRLCKYTVNIANIPYAPVYPSFSAWSSGLSWLQIYHQNLLIQKENLSTPPLMPP